MNGTVDRMVFWFRLNNCKATLSQILKSGEPWAYEFRARMTDARKRGIQFACQQDRRTPSNNLYRLMEQQGQQELL